MAGSTPLLLDGKVAAAAVEAELTAAVASYVDQGRRPPHLVAVLVGEMGPSVTYVNAKMKACARVGFQSGTLRLPATITQAELLAEVHRLNADPAVDGFIVQLPLPAHINESAIIEAVNPAKDVDGFHPINLGKLAQGLPAFHSATPAGIVQLLRHYQIETVGKHAVVIGRSNIVGTPIALLLSRNTNPGNCTVTQCHSRTPDLAQFTRQADILIVAAGKEALIGAEHIKPGAVVIDVGMHRVDDPTRQAGFRLSGDVRFAEVAPLTSAITPVPGGVGPMTIAMLMRNTLLAYQQQQGIV